ncbi:MAG: hypothetical protein WCX65_11745 [bacterium]
MNCIGRIVKTAVMAGMVLAISLAGGAAAKAQDAQAKPFKIVPIWIHVHTNFEGDGGSEAIPKIIATIKSKGYQGVIFNPHSDDLNFPAFKKAVDAENGSDFLAVPGREIITNTTKTEKEHVMCHVNAISDSGDPAILDHKFKAEQLPELLGELKKENAFVIWNHPWGCHQWEQTPGSFNAIELFNDYGPDYQNGGNYDFNKRMYLSVLKGGGKMVAIAGIDMHVMAQTTLGDNTTYVFPDAFNRESLVSALRAGSAIAAFNAKILSLNMKPSQTPVVLTSDAFEVKGAIALKSYNGFKPSIVVYKNGVEFAPAVPATLTRGEKGAKNYFAYDFSFGDKLAPGATACYVFEIPHYIVSSSFCFAGK